VVEEGSVRAAAKNRESTAYSTVKNVTPEFNRLEGQIAIPMLIRR
jgi:hypothetical protein